MDSALYANYLAILKHELVPALGCTEPIAIAYAAAKARQILGEFPDTIEMQLSGNIIKNVKGVTVPNSGGLKGIDVAAVLGVVGGNANNAGSSGRNTSGAHRKNKRSDRKKDLFLYSGRRSIKPLYCCARVIKGEHFAEVTIIDQHTNIIRIVKDDEVILSRETEKKIDSAIDKSKLTVKDILDFADQVVVEDVKEILERQIRMNTAISQEGLDNNYGAQIGKTLMHVWGKGITTRACASCRKRCPHGRLFHACCDQLRQRKSGNDCFSSCYRLCGRMGSFQREKLYRSLVVSNLIAIHQKYYIGSLSAYCGAVECGLRSRGRHHLYVWRKLSAGIPDHHQHTRQYRRHRM